MLAKRFVPCALLFLFVASAATAAEKRVFREGRFEGGELKYVAETPVLCLAGTPQEIGRQEAALVGDVVKTLAAYPRQLLILSGRGNQWDKCVAAARGLVSHADDAHRDELQTFAAKAGIPADVLMVANTVMDIYRGLGCSALMVEPAKSRTGGVLFGRNLDFYSLGVLDRYGLVAVYRPAGRHAFATVGFPGVIGCVSGMNDAGLAIAVHEVRASADGAPLFNPRAMPYTLLLRRVLESCTTIEAAEKEIRAAERSTILSLSICDRTGVGVLEITPKSVVLRRGGDGICVNTNHFRSPELAMSKSCTRYPVLSRAANAEKLGVNDVFHKLDEVNMGPKTVQAMVFEPGPLVVHLAMGETPATKGTLRTLELKPLFEKAQAKGR